MKSIGWAWVLLALFLPACEPRNLYVAHDTVVGVNAKVSQDRQQGQLVIGYDRDFVTVIPKSVDDPSGQNKKDAMALLSCTELEVDGIFLSKYVDITASGEAAKNFASRIQDDNNFFNCNFTGRVPK